MSTYLLKLYPKNIRGMLLMMNNIFGVIGGFTFPSLFQFFYNYSPQTPFIGVTIIDICCIIICFIFFAFGFGKPRPEVSEDDDSNISGSIGSETEVLGNTPLMSHE